MKHVKMLLYGAPGVGKSVFAFHFPRPFFITTDGNYEWLEDFGAKEEDHAQVSSFAEMKKLFKEDFDGYDTIVIDLIEDAFKWCEYEYIKSKGVDDVSDMGYGKGYRITRNDFSVEISKILSKPKNIILLSHETVTATKDRRGIDHYSYRPSSKIPDVTLDELVGKLRYCLHCYLKNEDVQTEDGGIRTVTKRYLSLIPKEDEYGNIRGIDANTTPQDIPLDAATFLEIIENAKPSPDLIVRLDATKIKYTDKAPVKKPEIIKPVKEVKAVKTEEKVEQLSEEKTNAAIEALKNIANKNNIKNTAVEAPKPVVEAKKEAAEVNTKVEEKKPLEPAKTEPAKEVKAEPVKEAKSAKTAGQLKLEEIKKKLAEAKKANR